MALVNLTMLFGGLFVGVPVILHLVMRQQPKHLIFPALRFIQLRRETNKRKLQLRHFLLLLLRCLTIAALAAALTRPSVRSAYVGNWVIVGLLGGMFLVVAMLAALALVQQRSKALSGVLAGVAVLLLIAGSVLALVTVTRGASIGIGDREAPVAAAIVIDTSPRMQFRQANKTRLEEAQETALWVVEQLPVDSDIDVASSEGVVIESYDVASAKRNIEVLQTTSVPEPLTRLLEKTIEKLSNSEKDRKEVYVFTDMSGAAWDKQYAGELQRQLDEALDVIVYVVDVSADNPQNFALGDLKLNTETLPRNGELKLETDLVRRGPAAERTVELHLEKPDLRRPIRMDGKTLLPREAWTRSETVAVAADSSTPVRFSLGGLTTGVHHGRVEIIGEDGLAIDDRRDFTIEVKEAWPVLIVAPADPSGRLIDGMTDTFVIQALAPSPLKDRASFDCNRVRQADLGNEKLDDYAAICLLDPQPLPPPMWEKMTKYVEGGGGLVICLGNNASQNSRPIKSFNSEPAQALLPGTISELWRSGRNDVFLRPRNWNHAIMAGLRSDASRVPWNEFPVHKHWGLRPQPNVDVIVTYTNNMPALIEKRVGEGRVFTITTPISEPARLLGRGRWNDLLLGRAWPSYVLIYEIFHHLVEEGSTKLNFPAGGVAVLNNDAERDPEKYQLFRPEDEPPRELFPNEGKVRYKFTNAPGAYRLKGSRNDQPIVRGFSVHLPLSESSLDAIGEEQLTELIGEDRFHFAQNQDEIDRDQGEARIGREFFPFLICLVALVLGLEQVLSNRFYKSEIRNPKQMRNPKS